MPFNKTISTIVLATGLGLASQTQAAQVDLNTYVSALLSNAVSAVKQDISYKVQESVLNATHSLSLSAEEEVKANVSIKEIAKSEDKAVESDEKA